MNGGADTLARLTAIEDIRALKARYFRHVDLREFAALAEDFTADAVFELGELRVSGRAAIIAWIKRAYDGVGSVHHGHNHEIEIVSAEEARGVVALRDYVLNRETGAILGHGAGHYHEVFRVENGGWRMAHVRLVRQFLHYPLAR